MISQSNFIKFNKCQKLFWLKNNMPRKTDELPSIVQETIRNEKEVFELAKQYFPDTFDCQIKKEDGQHNLAEQVELTKKALAENHSALAKASFIYENLSCTVDLLVKDEIGFSIYKVKASTKLKKSNLSTLEFAFQKYVLEKCGLKVNHIYIMNINKDYVFDSALDLNEFFKVECFDDNETINFHLEKIEKTINDINLMLGKEQEPETLFSGNCKFCEYNDYCTKNIPSDNIESLYGIGTKAYSLYNQNIFTISDYIKSPEYEPSKNFRVDKQIELATQNITEPYIDSEKLVEFLDKVKYPIYYLDFEMANSVIPIFNGFKPFERYPFQYSLHTEYENGKIEHREFLGESINCIRELAEQLVKDIPSGAQLVIYDASSEIDCIKYLAEKFSDLSEHLLSLTNDYVDLLEPFKNVYYYNIKQGGSNSIKHVMPALCPEMANDYNKLDEVHNGCDALTTFHTLIEKKGTDDYEKIRKAMLEYCKLDTLSMVKILNKLKELVK